MIFFFFVFHGHRVSLNAKSITTSNGQSECVVPVLTKVPAACTFGECQET